MDNVIEINKNEAHFVTHAICLDMRFDGIHYEPCFHRWVATVPAKTNLLRLECPSCGKQDSFASFIPGEFNQ